MNFWDNVKKKTGEILGHPLLQKASDVGESILILSSHLGENTNPISIGSALLASSNVFAEALNIAIASPISHYCKKHELQTNKGNLHTLLCDSEEYVDKVHNVFVFETTLFQCLEINPHSKIYWVKQKAQQNNADLFYGDEDSISEVYWTSKDFEPNDLADSFWALYPSGAVLENIKREARLRPLPRSQIYTDSASTSVEKTIKILKTARSINVSRSYLLYGKPGTGKTSFVEKVADGLDKRLLKLDASILSCEWRINKLITLFETLKPEMVLFEDFDRVDFATAEGTLLSTIDYIRREMPAITIFATINDELCISNALMRPGRFDEKIRFDLPAPAVCLKIVELYAKEYDLNEPLLAIKKTLERTPLTPAECKELVLRKKTNPSKTLNAIFKDLLFYRDFGRDQSNDEY